MNLTHPTNLVFVYGTLMRGQRAHYMMEGGTYLGRYTLNGYAMYNLGRYPGIVEEAGKRVIGEVYAVTEAMLPQMDSYEDEGSLYHRRTVTVSGNGETLAVQAYIYALDISTATPMGECWVTGD